MYDSPTMYDTTSASSANPVAAAIVGMLYVAVIVLIVASVWRIFTKAGKPGWAALIPIYNTIVQLEIVGRPIWWVVLLFIPLLNIVVAIIVLHDLSKSFGKGVGTTLLLLLLPFIGFPMLAWGDATYVGPAAGTTGATPTVAA